MKFMGFQFDGLDKSQFTDPPRTCVGGGLVWWGLELPRLQRDAAWCMRHVAWAWPWHRTVGDGYAGYADPSGACVYLGTVSPVTKSQPIPMHHSCDLPGRGGCTRNTGTIGIAPHPARRAPQRRDGESPAPNQPRGPRTSGIV